MKNILFLFLFLVAITLLLSSCFNSPIAFRSVVHQTYQNASTEGTILNQPEIGASNVEAPKTTSDAYKLRAKVDDTSKEAYAIPAENVEAVEGPFVIEKDTTKAETETK